MAVYDFIVVGSGIAGLSFALRASRHGRVLVLTKQLSEAGSTHLAQGGIASVMDPADSMEGHIRDTLAAGAGLCRADRVKILVEQGPEAVKKAAAAKQESRGNAVEIANKAIALLKTIKSDDASRADALALVVRWCRHNK